MQYTEDSEFIRHTFGPEENMQIAMMDLAPAMTVGIEIESTGELLETEFWDDSILLGWKAKKEGTVTEGIEFVSPHLTGTHQETKDLYAMCNMLTQIGQSVSDECGGHIHIGAKYLTSKRSYVNLVTLWANAEKILYEISNPPGELPRPGSAGNYAKPISREIEKAIEKGTINLSSEEDLKEFTTNLKNIQKGRRFFSLNFLNVNDPEKTTIEFRMPNGTINPKTWIENINLFAGIVRASEELNQIQQKPEQERTEEEQEKIRLFKRIGSQKLTEREMLDILLTLSVSAEKRKIYEERYEVNSRLLQDNPKIRDKIDGAMALQAISGEPEL